MTKHYLNIRLGRVKMPLFFRLDVALLAVQIGMVFLTEQHLDKGILFVHQGNFLITSNEWTIVADVTFETSERQLGKLKQHVLYLKQIVAHPTNLKHEKGKPLFEFWDIAKREVRHLDDILKEYDKELSEMLAMITIPRTKRGLIDAGGKLLKYLFGVANSEDVDNLNTEVDKLKINQKEIIHVIESQVSILNETLVVTEKNRERIKLLVEKQEHLAGTLEAYKFSFFTGSSLRFVEKAFDEFAMHLSNIREAIDVLGQRKLSSYLVPRKLLLETLREISNKLPSDVRLLELPQETNLFKFYQQITVTSVALPNRLRIFARVPLITPGGFFDLYESVRLPTYIPSIKLYAYYATESPFIALSRDRQSYMLLEEHDIQKCNVDLIRMCSPTRPIFRLPQERCEYALFMGNEKSITKLCEKHVVPKYPPIFRRIDDRGTWVYSTPVPLILTIKCSGRSSYLQRRPNVTKLINTGYLVLPMSCSGHLPGILLVSYFQSKSMLIV